MEARGNPVISLKKSRHKSIKDLRNQVRANQSAVQKLWKLKEEEKRFGKKDSMKKRWAGVECTKISVMLTAHASHGIPYLHHLQKVV